MDKIKETQEFLIKKFGAPVEKMLDGRKYRYVNIDLDNFNELMDLCHTLSIKIDTPLNETHIAAICDFAKNEVQPNVRNVNKTLNRIIKELDLGMHFGRKMFKDLLNDLETFYNSEKYSPYYTMNLFVKNIKCSKFSHKDTLKTIL